MHITELIRQAQAGKYAPVHVLVGEESFFIDRAVRALRDACIGDGPTGFNDEVFDGRNSQTSAKRIVEAANTLPMMANARFVLVRAVNKLIGGGSDDDGEKSEKARDRSAGELNTLLAYLATPSPTTCLVLTADKIDGRSKLATVCKKQGYWVDAGALKTGDVRSFINDEAKGRGLKIDGAAVAAIADALGTELAAIDDALERLSLYVGSSNTIDRAAVEACVTRIRVDTIWRLVDAIGIRDTRTAVSAASSLLSDNEPPLRVLAMIAKQLRMVARVRYALQSGQSPDEAARAAGAPPFKARDLAAAAKRFGNPELAAAFTVLAETDLALKGSRVPPNLVLEGAILRLCAPVK